MQKSKKKYAELIIASIILVCCVIGFIVISGKLLTYGRSAETIVSVEKEEKEGGVTGDTYHYTISTLKYIYWINGTEFTGNYETKRNLFLREGDSITVLYHPQMPWQSAIESATHRSFLMSACGAVASLSFILLNTNRRIELRKTENAEEKPPQE